MNALDLFTNAELIRRNGDFEDYLVDVKGEYYSVISLTYEYEEPDVNYQTDWFKSKEQAIKAYEEDLEIA